MLKIVKPYGFFNAIHLIYCSEIETKHTEVYSINKRAFKLEFKKTSSSYRKHIFCSDEIRLVFVDSIRLSF